MYLWNLWMQSKDRIARATEDGAHNGFLQLLFIVFLGGRFGWFSFGWVFPSRFLSRIPTIQFTFLIATEHWANIFIELAIIAPRSCFCVIITSQDHHCLCKIVFPMYITSHLSTKNLIFHFTVSYSASCSLQCVFSGWP